MPEETEMQEQVVEEQPVIEEAPEESSEVSIDDLPENIKDYIHELREEAKDRRKAHEPYKEAFKDYNDSEKEYLLNLVTTLSTDQETGANAMKELAQHLLGEEPQVDQLDELEVHNDIDIPESDLVSSENIAALVQEEIEKERMIQDVYEQSRALGFEPESPECEVLWDLALTPAINGDLEKAAELARAYLGDKAPANPNAEPVVEQQTLFPASATAAGTGTVADIEPQEVPSIKSDSMREKVLARLKAQVGE
tara:strand:- start:2039 stop:2797 length:759 start_codon:yes stop_codon:yes gene_type:complete